MSTKLVTVGGRNYRLPTRLVFMASDVPRRALPGAMRPMHREYDVVGLRKPHAGEFYLSGATAQAYYASQDISTEYIVVRPK